MTLLSSANSKNKIQNVVLLVVDCLRSSFLRDGGNSLDICPTINSLAKEGLACVNAHSHSWSTQLSCPSIFTSTLPLDHGGYDSGILNRPLSITEVLRDIGVHTVGFTPNPWASKFFGYNRGFDEYYEIFDISKFWIIFSDIYHRYYAGLFKKGILSERYFYLIMDDLFDRFLEELLRLCDQLSLDIEENRCPYDFSIHRHSFSLYQSILKQIQAEFLSDRKKYVITNLCDDISNKFKFFLTGRHEDSDRKDVISRCSRIPTSFIKRLGVQVRRYRHTVSTKYLRKQINLAIHQNSKRPFFIWSHLFEIHDNISTDKTFGWPEDFIKLGFQRILDSNNPIKKMNRIFALRLIDKQIAQIIEQLKSENLLEQTLVVICGDHGFTAKHSKENFGYLSEENTLVPIIFSNPNIKPHLITEPCGLQDIAPTILSLMGAEARCEFKGLPLDHNLDIDRPIILESLCPGPGDFRFKAINIAIIRGGNKLVWYESGYDETCMKGQNALFDLKNDPCEAINLYGNDKYATVVSELREIAIERCNMLRKNNICSLQSDKCVDTSKS